MLGAIGESEAVLIPSWPCSEAPEKVNAIERTIIVALNLVMIHSFDSFNSMGTNQTVARLPATALTDEFRLMLTIPIVAKTVLN